MKKKTLPLAGKLDWSPAEYAVFQHITGHQPSRCGGALSLQDAWRMVERNEATRHDTLMGLLPPNTVQATYSIWKATGLTRIA